MSIIEEQLHEEVSGESKVGGEGKRERKRER